MSIGKKLSVSITVIFGLFAFSFMAFQHYREKEFKIECLNIQLQDCNLRISESLSSGDSITDSLVESYVFRHEMETKTDQRALHTQPLTDKQQLITH